MSGLKEPYKLFIKSSNPLKTDKIKIIAAVPTAIPPTAMPEMILIAFVDFLANKYRRANFKGKFMLSVNCPIRYFYPFRFGQKAHLNDTFRPKYHQGRS